jgi:tetratricopeptide (TPR) repeat protein
MASLRSPISGLLAFLLIAGLASAPSSVRAGAAPQAKEAGPPAPEQTPERRSREQVLDMLFAQLKAAKSREAAEGLEGAIRKVWMASGSASIGLLMSHGLKALAAKDYEDALFYFDEVVSLAPHYSEGWNKRSAVHFLLNDYSAALADLEHVLRLEPRHFEALAGLAVILEDLGDKKGALDAYRRALELDPWLEGVPARIRHLKPEVEGRGI